MIQSLAASSVVGALVLLLASQESWISARGSGDPPAAAAPCVAMASAAQRIALADGTTLTIDASGVARRGQEVLILGTPTYLWAPGSVRGSAPLDAPAAFGVVRDARGRYALVPAPPGVPGAKHPRVVSAGARGWHAVFVTGSGGPRTPPFGYADAEIWYGRYEGGRWHEVSRIARADAAVLLPGMSSELVIAGSRLAFAYAYDHTVARNSNAPGNQGLVLLQRRGSAWHEDTLHTRHAPHDVQLARDTSGAILVAYTQSYFDRRLPQGPDLFTARYDTSWSPPRVTVKVPSRYVAAPLLPELVRTGSVVAWRSAEPGDMSSSLEWGMVTHDHAIKPMGHVAGTSLMDRPAMLQVDGAGTVWLVRDGESTTSLRVFVRRDTAVHDLGAIRLPLDNPAIYAVASGGGRMLVVSGALGTSPSDPPASSYLTAVTVRCAGVRK